MDFIDLHIHTTASDGSSTPVEVVDEALETGLYAIAITDHDTVAAVPYAIEAARGFPLKVISGVEISAQCGTRELHVLGYNIDYENQLLVNTLSDVAALRYERNEKMCELLRKEGIKITLDDLYEHSHSHVVTRADMARYLVDKRYVTSESEAYGKYIGTDAPCYIPRFKLDIFDVYKLIRHAGGVASLAHPVQYRMTDDEYSELFHFLKRLGFSCIEAIHSDNGPNDEIRFTELAVSNGLKITGGSDYHGDLKPDIRIGTGKGSLMVPKSVLANIGICI